MTTLVIVLLWSAKFLSLVLNNPSDWRKLRYLHSYGGLQRLSDLKHWPQPVRRSIILLAQLRARRSKSNRLPFVRFAPGFALVTLLIMPMSGWQIAAIGPEQSERLGEAPPARELPWFTEITEEAGLDFQHNTGLDGGYFMPEIVGSGGAIFDYDNDGDLDIYLVNSGSHLREVEASTAISNVLFRQEANGTFVDVTNESGLGDAGYGMGAAVGDMDNDGDADVYVTNFGRDALYRNNGDGTFSNVTDSAGISGSRWSTSACFFDFDRDGFLDLYVASYVHYDPPKACTDAAGRPEYCGPREFLGVSDVLYRNNGDGTFTDVSESAGINRVAGKGLGVLAADFNLDAMSDIYVANDGEENHLWINLGNGRFENQGVVRGASFNIFGRPEASMGVTAGDIEGDGDLDLFITHLDRETNTLYLNMGKGRFEDRTATSGLGPVSLPYTGFGTAFFDYDHDGDLDLLVVNGRIRRGLSSKSYPLSLSHGSSKVGAGFSWADYAEPNFIYENDGAGRFTQLLRETGKLSSLVEVSRSVMLGDIDSDGDLDILVTNVNGPARLFRNDAPKKGHWVMLRAFDPELNRDAIGALVKVEAGGKEFVRTVTRTFSYLASSPPTLHIGIGKADQVDRVTIRWPDGAWEKFPSIPADQFYRLVKGDGAR